MARNGSWTKWKLDKMEVGQDGSLVRWKPGKMEAW